MYYFLLNWVKVEYKFQLKIIKNKASRAKNSFAKFWGSLFFGTHCSFTPVWLCSYVFNLPDEVSPFTQRSHWNGFTPVWISLCQVKLLEFLNSFLHRSHMNGLTPVWLCLCLVKLPDEVNPFSHRSHMNGSIPVWIGLCVVKVLKCENSFSYRSHLNILFYLLLCFDAVKELEHPILDILDV